MHKIQILSTNKATHGGKDIDTDTNPK